MSRGNIWMHFGLVLLALHCLQMGGVSGQTGETQYIFEIQAHTYSNPQHQLSNGNNCRSGNRDCRNVFQFCLTAPSVPLVGSDGMLDCRLGVYQFQETSDDITFLTGSQIVTGQNVPNPMTFNTATGPWPGGFQLFVRVNQSADLVDRLNITRQFTEKEFTNPSVFSGEFNVMDIGLSFRLTCSANYFGADCETFCAPQNDSNGHFTCNSVTGQIECLPGYSNTATNCTTCVSPTICALEPTGTCAAQPCQNGGECIERAEDAAGYVCSCGTDFEGPNCEMSVVTTASPGSTTAGENNPDSQASSLSGGEVAGLVIGLLIVLVIVTGLVVGIGLIIWRCRPGTSGKFDITKKKEALDNPNYEVVEMTRNSPSSASATSPAPVYTTPNFPHNNNNTVPTLERTVDYDNPLYSSTALEDSNDQYVPMTHSNQPYNSTQDEDHDYDLPPEDLSYPPPPSQPPPPPPPYVGVTVADAAPWQSPVHDDLHVEGHNLNSSLNPYGEYGDGTLKRVASQHSVNHGGETEPQTVIITAVDQLFDNPDYVNAEDIDVSQ